MKYPVAVSQQISSLERQFKSLLIERSKRNPSDARGPGALRFSKQIIQTYDELHNKLQEIKDIIPAPSGDDHLQHRPADLPPTSKNFSDLSHRSCARRVSPRQSGYEDVLSNVVDLGLWRIRVATAGWKLCPCVKTAGIDLQSATSLCQSQERETQGRYRKKFIGFEPDIPTRKALDKILKDHGVEVQHVMEFDNVETVKRAVEIDAGIAIVPLATVVQEVAKQTLVQLPFEDGNSIGHWLPSIKRARCSRRDETVFGGLEGGAVVRAAVMECWVLGNGTLAVSCITPSLQTTSLQRGFIAFLCSRREFIPHDDSRAGVPAQQRVVIARRSDRFRLSYHSWPREIARRH